MTARKVLKKIGIIALILLLLIFISIIVLYFAIRSPKVQTFVAQKITQSLSEKLDTKIEIESIEIEFFNNITLENFLIEDKRRDTLIFAEKIKADFSYFSLFKKNIELSNFHLENSKVKLHRSESDLSFNFEKILPKKDPKTKKSNKISDIDWTLNVKDIQLENINFSLLDSLKGTNILVNAPSIKTTIKKFDIQNLAFKIGQLSLENPNVDVAIYKSKNAKNEVKDFELCLPFTLRSDQFLVENGAFLLKNKLDTNNYEGRFAFNEIALNQLFINLKNIDFNKESIKTKINRISFKEKSGFTVKELFGDFTFSNTEISFENFKLRTTNSFLNNHVSLTYNSLNDFSQFIKNINLSAKLKNSYIHPKDINYFGDLKDIHLIHPIKINGEILGTISNLRSNDIELNYGAKSKLIGRFSLNGLPNIQETFISINVSQFNSTYQEVLNIYPKTPLPDNFRKMGVMRFNGRFDGFISDFVAYGVLISDLGKIDMDLNLKLSDIDPPSYRGEMNMFNFKLGKFLGNKELIGKAFINAQIEGKGLKIENLDVILKGKIDSIDLREYRYKNIIVDGAFKDNYFEGEANIKDEFVDFDFKGLVDARGEIPKFKFDANLNKIHLLPLNLYKKDFILSGNLNTNFSANSIDNILGQLEINDFKIEFNNDIYTINNIFLNSRQIDKFNKNIYLLSDNIEANFRGNFLFSEIPNSVKKIVLPNFDEEVRDQVIRFDISLNDENGILGLFVPTLTIPREAKIGGNLNTQNSSMLCVIDIPFIQYKNLSGLKFNSNLKISKSKVEFINSLPEFYISDSLFFENITLLGDGKRKDLNFRLNLNTPNKSSSASINASLKANEDDLKLKIYESILMLNRTLWNFDYDNLITISKDGVKSTNFGIYNDDSQMSINFDFSNEFKNANLNVKEIELYDFTGFLRQKDIDIKGLANGNINIEVIEGTPNFSGNIQIDNIGINNYKVGNFGLSAILNLPTKTINIDGGLSGNENDIKIYGNYSFAKESTENDFDINFKINEFAVKTIDDFISEYIENSEGTVFGNLKLSGYRDKPELTGFVEVADVTTTVAYTKARYNIKNERVLFKKNLIDLGEKLKVSDLEGNTAFGKGKITHNYFKDLRLDIQVTSNKIIGLNTTAVDNEIFYGKAYLKGGANFTGLSTDVNLYIYGESEPQSDIEIPFEDSGASSDYTFFTFIEKNVDEDLKIIRSKRENLTNIKGITVRLDLNIDQDCEVSIILDRAAGDILKGRGEGNLTIDVSKGGEDVNFFGNYTILDGDYLFTLQNIINKRFRIEPNSTIQFNGPIEEATVNVDAVYSLRSSTYNLIQEFIDPDNLNELSLANNRVPIKLYLKLTEKLQSPTIAFDIKIEQFDPQLRNPIESKLQTIKLYENELNRQVFGLLVLNQFIPSFTVADNQIGGQTSITGSATNTVSEFLSNQLSRYFSDWLSYLVDDLDLSVNYRNYGQNLSGLQQEATLQLRRELQLALSKKFLDDRITINVGGNVDFGQENVADDGTNTFFGGDFSIEYAFSKKRRFRMKAFTSTDYDYFVQGNRTRAGIGVSYKKEFDKMRSRLKKDIQKGADDEDNE